jgi:hypothetical protein
VEGGSVARRRYTTPQGEGWEAFMQMRGVGGGLVFVSGMGQRHRAGVEGAPPPNRVGEEGR